jgi:biopolymer transport protein ExbB/TolQ
MENILILFQDEVLLWMTVKLILLMIVILVGSIISFYFLYYHTSYFRKVRNMEGTYGQDYLKFDENRKGKNIADIMDHEF